jgi:hypothetical protein
MDGVRRALDDPNPLPMLSFVSTLLCVTDLRQRTPFGEPADSGPAGPTREDLVGMFLDVPTPETSALLAVVAELASDDDLLPVRIRRELAARPDIQPTWLTQLSGAQTYRAVRMSHILGDGDNVMLGTRLAGGDEFTCIVYIDHNLGTLVKDAFVIPEPIENIVAGYQAVTDDPDTRWEDIPLADARACLDAAIELAAITLPPFESESWPACRALVEWVTRGLPAGGAEHPRPQWAAEELVELADRFFASPQGAPRDDADHRGLLESILWYGTQYGPGDPLRWSPVRVEILLADWISRKVSAPADYLAKTPDLLRAFIRFTHAEVGLRADLTEDALVAIDRWEPTFQASIRAPRAPAHDLAQRAVDRLARAVGGLAALSRLDDDPLPDEAFQWTGITDGVTERVQEVLDLVDDCCDTMFDVEFRTACRRMLARVSSAGPEIFRRKGRAETAAAAVVWMIGKVNDVFALYAAGPQVNEIMAHFGLKGSVSQRAGVMLQAAGFDCQPYDLALGSPEYLVAARRRHMIVVRDRNRGPD